MFVFYFSCIRKRAGGFHANSFIGCFIGTIGIYVVYSYLIFLFLTKHMCINITLVIAATIIIEIIGAVNHQIWNGAGRNMKIVNESREL